MTKEQEKICQALMDEEINAGNLDRFFEMLRHFNNAANDSGAYGRIIEISSHTAKSRKISVASQGKRDTSVKMLVNGKIRYIAAEVKTNGGRIENLYKKGAPRFVVYSMNFHNSLAARELAPILIEREKFLQVLQECGAIKSTNGKNPEHAIQVTSKKLYLRLADYPIPYEPDTVYTEADFEGLEV